MNFLHKPASFRRGVSLGVLLALGGCSDAGVAFPHMFGGNEVPPEVASAPRLVASPSPESRTDAPYPRLGDMPSKPKDFTAPPLIDATIRQMQADRAEGTALRDAHYPAPSPVAAQQGK